MKKETFMSRSVEETVSYFFDVGQRARAGDVYALHGELGAGKTVIASAIARGMGIVGDVTSPTFALLEIYDGRLPLYHFDLYRVNDERELDNLFFEEYWEGDGVSVIEWPEIAAGRLPAIIIKIKIEYIDENTRKISLEYPDI
ncbi:MAG: tRNA (adenosine(37)-N6)-threonylcarbamoyltransferase complex ATPase subunit type 1 TsaE [Leptospirales bacterium]|nr:tRNA (adenosine(37)-N6)-threonylcarbamoyltransferase complex ATPase subunit type 1 TsaE [Leptospirales bacterium]